MLYALKLHLAAYGRGTCGDQRRVPVIVRRDRDNRQPWMCRVTLSHENLSFPIVQIVVRKNEIKTTNCEGTSGCYETWDHCDPVFSQELLNYLLREDRMVLKVENIHGVLG